MKNLTSFLIIPFMSVSVFAYNEGKVINLNSSWDFEQTFRAFPPEIFSRECRVPGLIHLAEPRIESYDKLFKIKFFGRMNIPYSISLPEKEGGYLILSEFKEKNSTEIF